MSDAEAKIAPPSPDGAPARRRPYVRPQVKRVVLAMEETLATNCKQWGGGSPCDPDSGTSYTWEDGS